MTEMETLGILDEIQALVSDHLQVVSYKWLSRNFLVSSNAAKRLLEEFVEKHGSGLEVVYTISGWLKSSPPSYNIRLVSGPKLAEAKQDFDGNCSIQVYSVQVSVPKDPAALWNPEYVQAEELFKQPVTVDNCLRDNRFCGISNSLVKRNVEGTLVSIASVQPKTAGTAELSKSNSAHKNNAVPLFQESNDQQSSSKVALPSPSVAKDVQDKNDSSSAATKPSANKEKCNPLPASKTKGQNDKSSSSSGGSLANMWGRASAKSKPSSVPVTNNNLASNPTVSGKTKNSACEAAENGRNEDDAEDVNSSRASNGVNRKRRMVLDLSDEDELEDAVNLASPDPPKAKSCTDSKRVPNAKNPNTIFDELREDESKAKEDNAVDKESNQSLRDDSIVNKKVNPEIPIADKTEDDILENDINKNKEADSTRNSPPKRRKVLKTRIDERGREVTEVVWEGEETETKKVDNEKKTDSSSTTKKAENNAASNNINRPVTTKKPPATGGSAPSNAGAKAGAKKGGNQKDPKQGNILSFFKRV